jgi:hypothetical protein
MEILGWVFLALIAIVVLAAMAMGLVSLPDAKRYLRLRRM